MAITILSIALIAFKVLDSSRLISYYPLRNSVRSKRSSSDPSDPYSLVYRISKRHSGPGHEPGSNFLPDNFGNATACAALYKPYTWTTHIWRRRLP